MSEVPDIYERPEVYAPTPDVDFAEREYRAALLGPRGEVLRYRVDRLPPGYRKRNPH